MDGTELEPHSEVFGVSHGCRRAAHAAGLLRKVRYGEQETDPERITFYNGEATVHWSHPRLSIPAWLYRVLRTPEITRLRQKNKIAIVCAMRDCSQTRALFQDDPLLALEIWKAS